MVKLSLRKSIYIAIFALMFSKEEARELTKLFWTSFGKYMGKHESALGKRIKWTNYKTGIKDVYFRLRADKKSVGISIDIQHKDDDIRSIFYEQFTELKTVFTNTVGEWDWEENVYNENQIKISRISLDFDQKVNIYVQDTWGPCFYFFEEHMLKLDEFWSDFNEIFKQLQD